MSHIPKIGLVLICAIALLAAAPRYVLHAGDQLSVQVFGEQSLPQTVTILPGGDIFYPLAGRVHVEGLTPDQAAAVLTKALSKYIRQPIVSVSVMQEGQIDVLVLGNVNKPGKYLLSSGAHTTDALAAAGGIGPVDGNFPVARVVDPQGDAEQVDLQRLLHDGDTSVDVHLSDGTTVYVPAPVTFNVEVFGSVDKPGDVILHQGDPLAMAIARAGANPQLNPDLNRVQVRRTLPSGEVTTQTINIYQELQSNSVGFVMQKGDIVYVPQAKKSFGNQLTNGAAGGVIYFLRALVGL